MSSRKRVILGVTFLGLALGAGYAIRAAASGIPATGALTYAGVLEDANGPVNGPHNILLILYDAVTVGNSLCQSASVALTLANGHFVVPLPDTCTTAVSANPNVWVDVLVDGSDTGRTKIGAVPYAVEANRASGATGGLATQIVPSGAVMYFNLAACPSGWSTLAAAQGRYIVGLGTGGTLGATVGTNLSDEENRAVGEHVHDVNDPGHNHGGVTGGVANWGADTDPYFDYTGAGATCTRALPYVTTTGCANQFSAHDHVIASSTTGISIASAGTVPGTNAPYVELLACQKQ